MKKPIGYNGFAFSKAEDIYGAGYLATKKGKKEVKKINKRNKKHQAHLAKHGWDTTETWNLDHTITMFILPRLKSFTKNLVGYPYSLTEKKWDKVLKKMLRAFELMSLEDDIKYSPENQKKINKGLKLFAKYYQDLWS